MSETATPENAGPPGLLETSQEMIAGLIAKRAMDGCEKILDWTSAFTDEDEDGDDRDEEEKIRELLMQLQVLAYKEGRAIAEAETRREVTA
jgi:hypothetical protein